MELTEVKGTLQKESDEHDGLHVAVGVVYDDLELVPAQETGSLVVHVSLDHGPGTRDDAKHASPRRSIVVHRHPFSLREHQPGGDVMGT
jgi:hypothetical protein